MLVFFADKIIKELKIIKTAKERWEAKKLDFLKYGFK